MKNINYQSVNHSNPLLFDLLSELPGLDSKVEVVARLEKIELVYRGDNGQYVPRKDDGKYFVKGTGMSLELNDNGVLLIYCLYFTGVLPMAPIGLKKPYERLSIRGSAALKRDDV
ncbi:hypothetical protein [Vibrio mediterranei]|uniref:hypothetical protein n=1 Tax=Vibrio mediterranei TaxID=689 RepID=UPI0040675D8C